ncbi:hypothetical protein MaudCBS49596_008050, partial [Microsporum audouinii]
MAELSTADRMAIEKFPLKKSPNDLRDRLEAADQASGNTISDTADDSKKAVPRLLYDLGLQGSSVGSEQITQLASFIHPPSRRSEPSLAASTTFKLKVQTVRKTTRV